MLDVLKMLMVASSATSPQVLHQFMNTQPPPLAVVEADALALADQRNELLDTL